VGSVYPVPAAPVMYLPYAFLCYLAAGVIWIAAFYRRTPTAGNIIRGDLERAHSRYQQRPVAQDALVDEVITVR
jgi:Na+/H+ antiporter NhaC